MERDGLLVASVGHSAVCHCFELANAPACATVAGSNPAQIILFCC